MEILFIVAGVAGLAWFFLSGTHKHLFKATTDIRDEDLEDVYIDLKKKILITTPYEHEQEYQRLYWRMKALLARILERHKHFVLDAEARGAQASRVLMPREGHDSNGTPTSSYVVPYNYDLTSIEPGLALYLCFFLYQGGQIRSLGHVDRDPDKMMKLLDHLIASDYAPASFFKGLVLKYGFEVYYPSKVNEARELLEEAAKNGVGAASIELLQLHKYLALADVKSVHTYH